MRVLFVGQNPGKTNLSNDEAFVGTKSYDALRDWIDVLGIRNYDMVNCSANPNEKFTTNTIKQLAMNHMLMETFTNYDRIFALGKISSDVLNILEIAHFKLPHPSGLNRKLNDKKWLINTLKQAKDYLNEDF